MARQQRTSKTIRGFAATRDLRDITRIAASDAERKANTDCRLPDGTSDKACPRPARKKR
jgi:hypothetical protein